MYRDIFCQGGIPYTGFHDSIAGKRVSVVHMFCVIDSNSTQTLSQAMVSLKMYLVP